MLGWLSFDLTRRRGAVLLAAVTVAVGALNIAHAVADPRLRVAVATLLLLAPGLALSLLLFPTRAVRGTERLVTAGGLCLVVTILLGLVLNELPGGLTRTSWSAGLAIVTAAACGGVLAGAGGARSRPASRTAGRRPAHRHSLWAAVAVAFALTASAAGLAAARHSALVHDRRTTFTQLWGGPIRVGGRLTALRVGVTNQEGSLQTYRLIARAGDGQVVSRATLRLAPTRTRVKTMTLPKERARGFVVVELHDDARGDGVYRRVKIWAAR